MSVQMRHHVHGDPGQGGQELLPQGSHATLSFHANYWKPCPCIPVKIIGNPVLTYKLLETQSFLTNYWKPCPSIQIT